MTEDLWGDDSMDYVAQPVSVNCVKCHQHGERNVAYCGSEQRRTEDHWDSYGSSPQETHNFLWWTFTRKHQDTRKPCKVEGEHFHLYCQHCQFRWTEPLPTA